MSVTRINSAIRHAAQITSDAAHDEADRGHQHHNRDHHAERHAPAVQDARV